jgi:hypothetical protein
MRPIRPIWRQVFNNDKPMNVVRHNNVGIEIHIPSVFCCAEPLLFRNLAGF